MMILSRVPCLALALAGVSMLSPAPRAQVGNGGLGGVPQQPVITINGSPFMSWASYLGSPEFRAQGLRCQTPERDPALAQAYSGASDCSYGSTNPKSIYAPSFVYQIPVVVHVIQKTNGQGNISAAQVQSQIDILNEDFRALPGSNGANGIDAAIQFQLATVDPAGNPTTGITYSTNNTWFKDSGGYYNTLAWDTNRYLNIYTNNASGALGYVPDLPQGGIPGSKADRVVILWSSFGANGPIGPPYNLGRTVTHEVGHYLGLFHTFDSGCGSLSACYTTGDLICDTNRESSPNYGCNPTSQSCGSLDPVHNYMNYSDDSCMNQFTDEQARRMRCTLTFYRPSLGGVISNVWADLGQSLAGTSGAPQLVGSGPLTAGSTLTLSVSSAKSNSSAALIAGVSNISAPFKGGVLVPSPDVILLGLPLDGSGSRVDSFPWPAGVPSGLVITSQYWITDPAGPVGYAATNAVAGTTP